MAGGAWSDPIGNLRDHEMNANAARSVRRYHESGARLTGASLDRLLGLRVKHVEGRIAPHSVVCRYPTEQTDYESIEPYQLRAMFHRLQLGARDVFYDLGAGYGRVILYGALVTSARFVGIEIVAERADEIERCRRSRSIVNARSLCADARATPFPDTTVFFLNNPFFVETLVDVSSTIARAARRRHIRIASVGRASVFFRAQDWLVERAPAIPHIRLRERDITLFASR